MRILILTCLFTAFLYGNKSNAQTVYYSIQEANRADYGESKKLYLGHPKSLIGIENISNLVEIEIHFSNLENFELLIDNSTKLKSLKLIDCSINIELTNKISHLKRIEFLTISSCNLDFFPENILLIEGIKKIDLSNNKINRIPNICFNHPTLLELILSNNEIEEIKNNFSIKTICKLTTLDLYNNHIEQIPMFFKNLHLLSNLKLGGNELVKIPKNFRFPSQIKFLGLSNNNIENFDFECVNNSTIEIISLSKNQIKFLDFSTIEKSSLKKLFVDYNKLTNISIKNLVKLKELRLKGNSIKTLSLIDLLNLEKLDISKNPELQLKLINTPNISELKMNSTNPKALLNLDFYQTTNIKYLWIEKNTLTNEILMHLKKLPKGALLFLTKSYTKTINYNAISKEFHELGIEIDWR